MIYLESIKLKETHRCLEQGFELKFQEITLLVGNQGCGKSSLLSLLDSNSKIIEYSLNDNCSSNGITSFYFDTEKMNPRIKGLNSYSNLDGTDRGIGLKSKLLTHFQSHGEVLVKFTADRIKDAKNCILLLDEPECALSLNNQYKLINELKESVKRNVQVIVATHCLPLIESFDNVYSLEDRKWLKTTEFINKCKL